MKALMIAGFLGGVMAMLALALPSAHESSPGARNIAVNYAVYRNAAFLYVYKNKPASGNIPMSALDLPQNWQALRSWTTRIDSGLCYVYGPATAEEIQAARDLFQGSFAVGRADGGRLLPDGRASVPAYIPNGSLVSVTEVR